MKRVLVTKPEVGTTGWGLMEEGKEQAKNVSPFDCVPNDQQFLFFLL